MSAKSRLPELLADPFQERRAPEFHKVVRVLGAEIRFESNSAELMKLVDRAYAGLPAHRLPGAPMRLCVRLYLTSPGKKLARAHPAPLHMFSAGGILGGTMASSNWVGIAPREKAAAIVISPRMLRFPYHTRYELIEFAVFTLAARTQGLVAVHAACVGLHGSGVLLMGHSGAGKSTVTLQCMQEGWDLLAEDSVFVGPDTLLATGVGNFIHIRADSLRWVPDSRTVQWIRGSPTIRRRSGVRKFEIDMRGGEFALAARPLKIIAVVFLSPARVSGPLLRRLPMNQALTRLAFEQAYAAEQPSWLTLLRTANQLRFFELRRGDHPRQAVAELRALIGPPIPTIRRPRPA